MKIKWLGHASFLITSDTGTRIITDPYATGNGLSYGEITESADVVTVSHDHFDHNNVAAVRGEPKIVKEIGISRVKGIEFKGMASYHDETGGHQRGNNTIFCFEADGIRVCHLGDLGHLLNDKQIADIGKVDILFIPVGGYYTIDAKVATQVCSQLNPKVIIPMHFKTDKCTFPIASVDEFLKGKERITRLGTSERNFIAEELPASTQIIVFRAAL